MNPSTVPTRRRSAPCWGVLLCVLAMTPGCGRSGPEFAPVAGKVLIDGKPLTLGVVKFAPVGGRQSMGAIGPDGAFTLGSYQHNDGAMVGEHRVAVVAREQITETKARWHAPKKYANASTSGLTCVVTPDLQPVVIELTWGGVQGPLME